MPEYPLVSCITPTYNRRTFFSRSIKCFLAYDYPNLEWLILDDGQDPIQNLLPNDPRIKYFYELPKQCHAMKMNRCCELAHGEFFIVHDDDDWYAPDRVRAQVEPLIADPTKQVSGLSEFFYYVHGERRAYRYRANMVPWMGAIALRRSTWEALKFDSDPRPGADNRLLQKIPRSAWHDVKNPNLIAASIHSANDCKKAITSSYVSEPWDTIQKLVGDS